MINFFRRVGASGGSAAAPLARRPAARNASRLATLCGVFASLVLVAGCALADDSPSALTGYWKSGYGDGFSLYRTESGTLSFAQYDDAQKNVSFSGTVVNDPDLWGEKGALTVKIVDGGTWLKTVDEYVVVRWQSLGEDTVEQAVAYSTDSGADNDGLPTAAEAEAEYTVANGYFGYFGEYGRQ